MHAWEKHLEDWIHTELKSAVPVCRIHMDKSRQERASWLSKAQ